MNLSSKYINSSIEYILVTACKNLYFTTTNERTNYFDPELNRYVAVPGKFEVRALMSFDTQYINLKQIEYLKKYLKRETAVLPFKQGTYTFKNPVVVDEDEIEFLNDNTWHISILASSVRIGEKKK